LNDAPSPRPTLDSTRLLGHAAVDVALGTRAGPKKATYGGAWNGKKWGWPQVREAIGMKKIPMPTRPKV
jgi:hypothetical protein